MAKFQKVARSCKGFTSPSTPQQIIVDSEALNDTKDDVMFSHSCHFITSSSMFDQLHGMD